MGGLLLRIGTSSGLFWSGINSACSIFSVGNQGLDIGPPACPPCCSWPSYPVRCSTEVSIKVVTSLDKVFLPTVLPPQTQKASSFAGVRGKGATPHPWNWTSVDFNESCVAKSHATLKLEGLNPFCFCLLVCGWEKQNSHVFWIALTDKSGQQLRVNHSISAHPQPSLIYVYILKWLQWVMRTVLIKRIGSVRNLWNLLQKKRSLHYTFVGNKQLWFV